MEKELKKIIEIQTNKTGPIGFGIDNIEAVEAVEAVEPVETIETIETIEYTDITCNIDNVDIPSPIPKSGDFDTLVLSGGSIHAIIMLGALQYSDDNHLLNKIHRYVGTSAGSMCCYLLAIGYTPTEIMVFLCTKQMLEKMKNFNVVAMMNGSGATSFSHIHEQLEKMTIEKLGQLITLGDLYNKYNKELICLTHNLTSDKLEILSHETHPEMPCLIAIRMSSNLPFIFDNFKYLGSFYIDGAISNNFPIDIADKKGEKILGMVIYNTSRNFREDKSNIVEYMYQLMSIPIKQNVLNKISSASDKCTTVILNPDNTPFFDFSLDTHKKLEMFSDGYIQMKNYWEN
jgi:predicted acylesterase/phospholipase RssA